MANKKKRKGLANLERRDSISKRLNALNKITRGTKKDQARSWDSKEQKEVEKLTKELEKINRQIDLENKAAKALSKSPKRRSDKYRREPEEAKIQKRYSITKALRHAAGIEKPSGVEKEMHEEALREAKKGGFSVEGFGVPTMIAEQRLVQEVGTAANAGNFVETNVGELVPHLRPNLVLQELGATVVPGLVGNLDVPVGDATGEATATGEKGTSQEVDATTVMRQARPHRYSGTIPVTRQMMMQSSVGMDKYISGLLQGASDEKVNRDCILGGGTNEIEGVLSTLTPTSLGANGAQLTRDFLLNMEERIDDANAIDKVRKFLITNAVKRFAKGLKVDDGSGKFLYTKGKMIDYDAIASTLTPNDLTKGTSVGVCSAIIFGNWSRFMLCNWGTRDLIIDPYSRKKEGIQEVTINSFWDGFVTHHNAFDVYADVLTA